jgi:hypothetical protein
MLPTVAMHFDLIRPQTCMRQADEGSIFSGTSSISTVVEPGATGGPCSQPHVNTIRSFSITSRTRSEAKPSPVTFTLQRPPVTSSISASVPCHAIHLPASMEEGEDFLGRRRNAPLDDDVVFGSHLVLFLNQAHQAVE